MKTASTLHCHGFNEHDRTVIKSLLRSFGELPNSVWSYAEEDLADLVLVDCDNLLAVRDVARGRIHGKRVVACSVRGASCDGANLQMDKPLRPRLVIGLLLALDEGADFREHPAANDAPTAEPMMMFPVMF